MKKGIVCSFALILAFAIPAFCEDSVAKNSSKDSIASAVAVTTTTVANEVAAAKSAVNTAGNTVKTSTTAVVNAVEENKAQTEAKITEEAQGAKAEIEETATKVAEETKTEAENKVADEKEKVETKVAQEAPATVTTSKEPVADDKTAKEKSGNKKIFNYSKDSSKTEIEIKVGKTISPKPEINREAVDVDSVYTLGIEVVAYSNSFIGLGAGIYNVFDSKIKHDGVTVTDPREEGNHGEYKIAFTNPYLTLKSKILQFDSDIIRNVYIFGQIGYGFMRIENAYETEDGMYWGVGGGVDIWHFLVDVNYATNFGKIKMNHGEKKVDVRQSTIIVSLGYRFSL